MFDTEHRNASYLPDMAKVTHPTIEEFATEYADSDTPEYVADILKVLPNKLRQPIQYTFAKHVTKERPLEVLYAGKELGASTEKALGLAACIDVLWNVGIIIDDVYDKDETNARLEPSAWSKFGKATALTASTAAVAATVTYAAKNYGPKQAFNLSRDLQQGVASLTQSRKLSLESPLDDYFNNYDMRSAFYTKFPIGALQKYTEVDPVQISGVQLSLARMNRAGQMINDLQDFDESIDRSRTDSFSDIRNGVSSIPIRHIWHSVDQKTQERFATLHGKEDLTDSDIHFIRGLTDQTELGPAMLSKIHSEYGAARDHYIDILSPSKKTVEWLDKWLEYKQDQANNVALSLGNSALLASNK